MDEARYLIRPFQDDDFEPEASLSRLTIPGWTMSADESRRVDAAISRAPIERVKTVVEERATATPVAFGYIGNPVDSYDPKTFWVDVRVHPDHQGRGVARALAEGINAEAERRGAVRLWAGSGAEDSAGMRFWTRRGFVERRRLWDSRLELANAQPPADHSSRLAAEGFTFTTLAEAGPKRRDLFEEICEVDVAVLGDAPRMGPFTPEVFRKFVEGYLQGPGLIPEAAFLAQHGGRIVGLCLFERSEGDPKTLNQMITGTLRAFRGRGVATELKRRSLAYGRAAGYTYFRTSNDSQNAKMWSINERLGYRPERVWIHAEKLLPPAGPA
ncbi:MAG: GNAT family N-acetyltransferase [Thermoplasmata archaeon]|nr:GNAT family N-acetyltransferase [Thermoplasmata archaeon]MCI4356151.1 GNAT family N-acetyltransferase [Thermoplasmata archaeon]